VKPDSLSRSAGYSIAFISSNASWGGSEELWSAAAVELARSGHRIIVYKGRLERKATNVRRLRELGCTRIELATFPFLPNQIYSLFANLTYPLTFGYQAVRLYLSLRLRKRPDLVVMSQGGNHDGWLFASVCVRLGLNYVLISQKATELYWPLDTRLDRVRAAYAAAGHAYFVSEHNRRLTEEQLGASLERSSVVRNPFLVPWERRDDWPDSKEGFRLACVGRLYPMEKGQDLALRVLARDKWRRRPVSLTFFGSGEQKAGLEQMTRYLDLQNVTFAGQVEDVASIWDTHHGLLLPSRAEGLPLVIVETMMSGRVPIVTDVAGNGELIEDNETGFLAVAPTEDALDEAMERAWQRRHEWRAIGALAAERIRAEVPRDPGRAMADLLLEHLERATPSSRRAEPLEKAA
jgi:glycosyltransferase involved in cell wall biosynthesis